MATPTLFPETKTFLSTLLKWWLLSLLSIPESKLALEEITCIFFFFYSQNYPGGDCAAGSWVIATQIRKQGTLNIVF